MGLQQVEAAHDHVEQTVARRSFRRVALAAGQQLLVDLARESVEHRLFGGKAAIELRERDARLGRDVAQRDIRPAAALGQPESGVYDGIARARRRLAPGCCAAPW